MRFYYYDLETYPNCFLFTGKFEDDQTIYTFELSSYKDQKEALLNHLIWIRNQPDVYMVGYNSLGFDYPILHQLIAEPWSFTPMKAYLICQQIIGSQNYGNAGNHTIRLSERYIPQIDLLKVNHFDNAAKRVSLKALQCAMRSESVEDLPFPVGIDLDREQIDIMIKYNVHDVTETEKFGKICKHHIMMRKELLDQGVLSGDVLNYSDVKIGTEYLIRKIGRPKCFTGSTPKQSFRTEVRFKNVILPKINFRTEPFQEVLNWFNNQVKYIGKETTNPELETELAGLKFKFGIGGVHASVESRVFHSDDDYVIKDIDVSGMYVAVAIANGFAPEHLGADFSVAYRQLQRDRAQYKKGTTMNLVLKLAGNGVYGVSNNPYSCLYDPKYTFSVTVNGQMQLLQLVEFLSSLPRLQLIQANTDGITCRIPRSLEPFFNMWKAVWESETGLKLEEVEYQSMWISDVNNYVAIDTKGNIKRKGRYQYPIELKDYWGGSGSEWHKNFSNLASVKAAELCLLHGMKPEAAIRLVSDPFDFMLRYKAPSGNKLFIGDKEQQKTTRYYVSIVGDKMKKVAPARGPDGQFCKARGVSDDLYKAVIAEIGLNKHDLRIHTKNKSIYKAVHTEVEKGFKVKECNHCDKFTWDDLDLNYYVKETEKLLIKEPNGTL